CQRQSQRHVRLPKSARKEASPRGCRRHGIDVHRAERRAGGAVALGSVITCLLLLILCKQGVALESTQAKQSLLFEGFGRQDFGPQEGRERRVDEIAAREFFAQPDAAPLCTRSELGSQNRRGGGGKPQAAHALAPFFRIGAKRVRRPLAIVQDQVAHEAGVAIGDRQPLPDDRIVMSGGIANRPPPWRERRIGPAVFVAIGVAGPCRSSPDEKFAARKGFYAKGIKKPRLPVRAREAPPLIEAVADVEPS